MKIVLLAIVIIASGKTFAATDCAEKARFNVVNSRIDNAANIVSAEIIAALKVSCDDNNKTFMTKLNQVSGLALSLAEYSKSEQAQQRDLLRQASRDLNSAAGLMLLIGTESNFYQY